jgi:serine/threonine protein phosphatase PrpC
VRATGPADAEQPDAYYAQRNVVALARGMSAAGAGQRAAALTLSAVMTSPLGRSDKAEEALRTGVESANKLVRSVAGREPRYSDMATTLDVVYLEFQGGRACLYFAHVGNSSVWLKRASSSSVELLTQSDAPDGPLLRAVGLNPDLTPSIGAELVDAGDRVFLTTASPSCFVTHAMMDAAARNGGSLHECAAALAAVVRSPAAEGITIVAVEVSRFASFVA